MCVKKNSFNLLFREKRSGFNFVFFLLLLFAFVSVVVVFLSPIFSLFCRSNKSFILIDIPIKAANKYRTCLVVICRYLFPFCGFSINVNSTQREFYSQDIKQSTLIKIQNGTTRVVMVLIILLSQKSKTLQPQLLNYYFIYILKSPFC